MKIGSEDPATPARVPRVDLYLCLLTYRLKHRANSAERPRTLTRQSKSYRKHGDTPMDQVADQNRWVPDREVKVSDKIYLQRYCERCRRSFVMARGETEWRAAHVGLLRFDILDEETNSRWRSEGCPGPVATTLKQP